MKSANDELDTLSTSDIEEDFYLVEDTDYTEAIDYKSYPWLQVNHPLYFPATQTIGPHGLTRWKALDKFSVENWYPHLKKHTFKSSFITLNRNDIEYLLGNNPPGYNSTHLEEMFNEALAKFDKKEAFIRLSTRSPKDSAFLFEEASTIMSEDCVYWTDDEDKHQQLVSFVASMLQAMKVKDGRKVIEMIQQSPRVYSDLLALISSTNPIDCTTNVILREWHDIRPDHEFRVFVSRRDRKESVVTAISQYFHFLHFNKSPADCFNFLNEDEVETAVKQFENYVLKSVDPDVAKFLNFSAESDEDSLDCIREYIVDLALIPTNQYHGELTAENRIEIGGKAFAIVVIELNPFAPSATGSGLFNWKNDLMMLWGKEPHDYPIVRFRQTPREDLSAVTLLPGNYASVIEKAVSKRQDIQSKKSPEQPPGPLNPSITLLEWLTPLMSSPVFGIGSAGIFLVGLQALLSGGLLVGGGLILGGTLCMAGHAATRFGLFSRQLKTQNDELNSEALALQ